MDLVARIDLSAAAYYYYPVIRRKKEHKSNITFWDMEVSHINRSKILYFVKLAARRRVMRVYSTTHMADAMLLKLRDGTGVLSFLKIMDAIAFQDDISKVSSALQGNMSFGFGLGAKEVQRFYILKVLLD
jgi:hypothetical protein